MRHCCETMEYYATEPNKLLDYDKEDRSDALFLHNNPCGTHQRINHCPWYGTKLELNIRDVWVEILENEYEIKEPYLNRDKIPKEFKTDEWWKKRGL